MFRRVEYIKIVDTLAFAGTFLRLTSRVGLLGQSFFAGRGLDN